MKKMKFIILLLSVIFVTKYSSSEEVITNLEPDIVIETSTQKLYFKGKIFTADDTKIWQKHF